MSLCPKCHRPRNLGNSPNSEECGETDDDEGICEAYAKIFALRSTISESLVSLQSLSNDPIQWRTPRVPSGHRLLDTAIKSLTDVLKIK